MISAILDHLWQSTLLATAVAILALAFRKASASVRYGLWFTASVKFLVPFAGLAALGRLLAPEIPPPAEAAPDAVFIAGAASPLAHTAIAPAAGVPLDPALILLGVWALGCAVVLIFWITRWARIRPLVRLAAPLALAAPMPVLASPTMLEPGLVGLWRPVLLVPETLFDHLDRPGIEALVAHEACHYRRGDNLTAAVHMLVEALFWFHPMVWWIGGRLVEERERACDEAVVGAGHDPAVYASSLLECCRLFLQSPLRCVAGASGSNLSRRVETIMTSPLRSKLSRPGKAVLAAAGVCALASPVAAGWLASPADHQATPRALALASSPASALADDGLAAASAPDRAETVETIRPARADAAPPARVQRIAAIRPEPIQLGRAAEDQPPPELAKPLPPVTTGEIPDARLVPVAGAQAASPGDGDTAPASGRQSKKVCKVVRVMQPSPFVTQLCLTRDDWQKISRHPASRETADFDRAWLGSQTANDYGPYADPLGQNSNIGAYIANSVPAMAQAAGQAAAAARGR